MTLCSFKICLPSFSCFLSLLFPLIKVAPNKQLTNFHQYLRYNRVNVVFEISSANSQTNDLQSESQIKINQVR